MRGFLSAACFSRTFFVSGLTSVTRVVASPAGMVVCSTLTPIARGCVGGDAQVVLDAALPPAAAGRWMRMIDGGLVVDEALRAAAQLARIDADRRRDVRRRGLQQRAGDVLPPAGVARAAEPVGVE